MRSPIVRQLGADKATKEEFSLPAAQAGCRPQALAGGARDRYVPKRLLGWGSGKLLQFDRATSGATNTVMIKSSAIVSVPSDTGDPWQIGH